MTDEEWREEMAQLDGWKYLETKGNGFQVWQNPQHKRRSARKVEHILPKYDTLKDMLRVCWKQGWTVQILQWPGRETTVVIIAQGQKFCNGADTPQAALRQAIEKVIGGGDE